MQYEHEGPTWRVPSWKQNSIKYFLHSWQSKQKGKNIIWLLILVLSFIVT